MAYIENSDFLLVLIYRGLIVVIEDKNMKIYIHGNFCMFISKQPEPKLDCAREGNKLQSKMAANEILNFSYYFNLIA